MNQSIVDAYDHAGLVVLPGFFSPETTAELAQVGREVIDAVSAGAVSRTSQFTGGFDVARLDFLKRDEALKALAVSLLGPDVKFFFSRVLMKDHTFSDAIAPHQDWPYYGGDTRKLNLFIPLTHCGPDNGMLVFYERSQKMGPLTQGYMEAERFPELTPVAPSLEVGDIVASHILTWHSSVPATVQSPRVLVQMVLTPGDDPCTLEVLAGQCTSPFFVANRFSPMARAQPDLHVGFVRQLMADARYDEAAAMARGILAHEPRSVEAALVLADIDIARGGTGENDLQVAASLVENLSAEVRARQAAGAEPDPPPAEEPTSGPPPGLWRRLLGARA